MPTTYTLPDGRTLSPGQAFTLANCPIAEGVTDTLSFPSNWLELATDADLIRFNITKTVTADPPPSGPTESDYTTAIQNMIDGVARDKQYTDGNSCATYAMLVEDPPGFMWKEEATAFVAWRATIWAYAFAQLAAVNAGQRSQPSVHELIVEIQTAYPMSWPS